MEITGTEDQILEKMKEIQPEEIWSDISGAFQCCMYKGKGLRGQLQEIIERNVFLGKITAENTIKSCLWYWDYDNDKKTIFSSVVVEILL